MGSPGRAPTPEEDALVLRGQVSNLQGNTGCPSAEIAGGTGSRGAHMARWEKKGGWQGREEESCRGKEASGEGA